MQTSKQISVATLVSLVFLSGCTNTNNTQTQTTPVPPVAQDTPVQQEPTTIATVKNVPATSTDVIYTEELSYTSPAGKDTVKVSMVTQNGIITSVTTTPLATHPISLKLQTAFAEGVSKSVVGKPIKGLKVDTVSWASLTTTAFNTYLASME
jgi:hypothetical protein